MTTTTVTVTAAGAGLAGLLDAEALAGLRAALGDGRTARAATRPGATDGWAPWATVERALLGRATAGWTIGEHTRFVAEHPLVTVRRDAEGAPYPETGYEPGPADLRATTLDPVRLQAALRDGATLELGRIDLVDPEVTALADDAEARWGIPATARLRAKWRQGGDPAPRTAGCDELVVHLEGRERWLVTAPGAGTDGPVTVALAAGDVLAVPMGAVVTSTLDHGPVRQLVIELHQPSAADLLEWVTARLADEPDVRGDLPYDPVARDAQVQRIADRLLAELARPDLVDAYLAERAATARPTRPRFALPWAATRELVPDDPTVVVRAATAAGTVLRPGDDGSVTAVLAGRAVRLDAAEAARLAPVLRGAARPLGDLLAGAPDPARLRSRLGDLVLAGHLVLTDPAT